MKRTILVLPTLAFACTRQSNTSSVPPGGYEDQNHKNESNGQTHNALSDVNSQNSNSAGHSPSIPRMRLQVTVHEGQPVIHVAMCDPGDGADVYVHDIAIEDPGFHGFETRVYCLLRERPDAGLSRFPGSGWKYGTEISGYELRGTCAALEPGRKYAADVVGTGVGGAVFSMEKDGSVRVHEEDCEKAKARKGSSA